MPSDYMSNNNTYSKIILSDNDSADGNDLRLPPPRFDSFKRPLTPKHTYYDARILEYCDEKAFNDNKNSKMNNPYLQYFKRPSQLLNQHEPFISEKYLYNDEDVDSEFSKQNNRLCPCSIVSYISLITGIVLILLSLIFEFQSRYHIAKANDFDHCPTAPCIEGCYKHLPFYYPPSTTTLPPPPISNNNTIELVSSSIDSHNLCTVEVKQYCDGICGDLGINAAKIYGILFMVFITVGGFFVILQISLSFVRYYCLGYRQVTATEETKL
ncbi:hypothetical protein BDF20DRAFT_272407 [Mycotypha africana]|uniref:uncharacterized protein n=1 Tax=Mycotypha africana TaxID=64632 RepID=UPI002301C423|nr:uncharacterized protein BDF20DRAFT_272407 [Mycotypha africana]KAI8987525.1 hypothetical protein BDF20DRAFT_272407 [Mycotypha africana]